MTTRSEKKDLVLHIENTQELSPWAPRHTRNKGAEYLKLFIQLLRTNDHLKAADVKPLVEHAADDWNRRHGRSLYRIIPRGPMVAAVSEELARRWEEKLRAEPEWTKRYHTSNSAQTAEDTRPY